MGAPNVPDLSGWKTATIASGGTISDAVYLRGQRICAVQAPALWGTAGDLGFQASADGTSYAPVNDDAGSPLTVGVVAGQFSTLLPLDFRGFRYVKVTSTAAAPADLAVSLIVSP